MKEDNLDAGRFMVTPVKFEYNLLGKITDFREIQAYIKLGFLNFSKADQVQYKILADGKRCLISASKNVFKSFIVSLV